MMIIIRKRNMRRFSRTALYDICSCHVCFTFVDVFRFVNEIVELWIMSKHGLRYVSPWSNLLKSLLLFSSIKQSPN